MSNIFHKDFKIEHGIHVAYSFEYSDQTARESAIGLTVYDEGKFARQLDNNTMWMLTDYSGPTWQQIGSSDVLAKVSSNDTNAGYLENKLSISNTINSTNILEYSIANEGGNEKYNINLDETKINHNNLINYSIDQHRVLNDSSTLTTELWSASKITTELAGKSNTGHTHTESDITDLDHYTSTDFNVDFANKNHSDLNDDEVEKHRVLNDSSTLTTELWSASKITTELAGKSDTEHTHTESDITDLDHTDNDAVHISSGNEISSLTEKSSLHIDDIFIIEDAESSYVKKKIKYTNIPVNSHTHTESDITDLDHTDLNAIHITEAGEINGLIQKNSADMNDILIVEDDEDSFTKKKIKISNISHSILSDIGTNSHSTIDAHIASTSNPHSVTSTQVGLGNVQNVDQTDPTNIVQDSTHRFVSDDLLQVTNESHLALTTGIITKGTLSVDTQDATKLHITAGTSLYVNNSDPENTIVEVLSWNEQSVTPIVGANGLDVLRIVWVGIERVSSGVGGLVFSSEFTAKERRTIAILGRCWSDGSSTTIQAATNYQSPAWGWDKSFEDFCYALGGAINIDGNEYMVYSGTLKLQKSSGHSFRLNSYSGVDLDSPGWRTDAAQIPISDYKYWAASGNLYGNVTFTELDPGYYDNGGTRTTVTSGKFTNQRVYYFPGSGTNVVTYGQTMYDTLDDAYAAALSEEVSFHDIVLKMFQGSILRAIISIEEGCTDTSNATDCKITLISGFSIGGSVGGGTAVSDHALLSHLSYADSGHTGFQPALGYTPVPETRTINGHTLDSDVSLTNSDIGLTNVTNDAQLKRAANDFTVFTEKTMTSGNDLVIIEDSENSYDKKKVKLSNITGSTTFPIYRFSASKFDTCISSDWHINDFSYILVDDNNDSLFVRKFDYDAEEAVGFYLDIPMGATNIKFKFISRAQIAPTSSKGIVPKIYFREIPDNSSIPSWSSGYSLNTLLIPTNENWQKDTQEILLSTLGMSSDKLYQLQLSREYNNVNDTLESDWFLLFLIISFS